MIVAHRMRAEACVARWTGAHGGQFAYSTKCLIDVENAIIVDVEATTAIRQAEMLAAKRMSPQERVDGAIQAQPRRSAQAISPAGEIDSDGDGLMGQ